LHFSNFHINTISDAKTYASSQDIKYFETSAKDNVGVEEMFTEITRQALAVKLSQPQAGSRAGNADVKLGQESSGKKKSSCCK
jgi:GTPase SAR1 family protein